MSHFTKQLLFISLGIAILVVGGVLVFGIGDKGAAPVAQWKFDEGSGNYAYDSSGNANTGALHLGSSATSSAWVSGVYGGAMSFDGVDDYVETPDNDLENWGSLTFSAWIKRNSTGIISMIITKGSGDVNPFYDFSLNINASNQLCSQHAYNDGSYKEDTICSTATVLANGWHNVMLVVSSNETWLDLYLDGINVKSSVMAYGIQDNNKKVIIGKEKRTSDDGFIYSFNGLIDDVRIYNYARTADQIKRDYNAGKALYVGARASDCDVDPASCVNKGLVGYWDMDQMGGTTATDKSGNGNTGTLTNGPVWTTGVQPFSGGKAGGGALRFDGVDDYVSIGTGLGKPTNWTESFWIKPNAWVGCSVASGNGGIKDTWGWAAQAGQVYVDTSNGTNGQAWNVEAYNSTNYLTNSWTHITISVDGSNLKYYKNGVLATSTAQVYSMGGTPASFSIGREGSYNGNYCNGSIDDVRIYNRALSAAEIRYQYNQGKPIAHWKMDEGADTATTCNATGSLVYDYSGQGNTGTLYNANATPATSSMWSDGKYGCALSFDGVDDLVSFSSLTAYNSSSSHSYSTWIKPGTLGSSLK